LRVWQATQEPERPWPERLFLQKLLSEDGSPEGTISAVYQQLRQVRTQQIPTAAEFWSVIHHRWPL